MNATAKLAGFALALGLAGCAAMQAEPGPALTLEQRLERGGYSQGEAVDRIPGFGLSGWNYLDERHIIVENAPREEYLITFAIECPELAHVHAIGHTSTVGALSRLDRIVARGMGVPVRCPIREIHRLERAAKPAS